MIISGAMQSNSGYQCRSPVLNFTTLPFAFRLCSMSGSLSPGRQKWTGHLSASMHRGPKLSLQGVE